MGRKQLPPIGIQGGVMGAEDRLAELRAIRDVMAAHIDNERTLARDLAALVRQFRDVSKEIEELEAARAEAERGALEDVPTACEFDPSSI